MATLLKTSQINRTLKFHRTSHHGRQGRVARNALRHGLQTQAQNTTRRSGALAATERSQRIEIAPVVAVLIDRGFEDERL
jgi:hypothetical protein